MRSECCPTCGGLRYCAPSRCYCGHGDCPAFASWIDMSAIPLPPVKTKTKKNPTRSTWDNREDSTWIDQL